jgi:polysaccharide export outer membrane protein
MMNLRRYRALTAILSVLVASGLFAQQETKPQKAGPPELAPATGKTKDEAAAGVKAPSGPAPVYTAAPVDPKTYVIGPEDILAIRVWKEPELSGGVQVRPDGKFTMPLIGEMQAAGLTPEQLTLKITESLTKFINNPEVMVSLQSVQSKKYYITGEVNRTGAFPLVVPITVLEALTNAGGFREYANTKRIVIIRGKERLKFNYKDVIKGKNLEQNIRVQDGDYIVVPE